MICEAIVKLKVRRGSCVCVHSCGCIGDGRGPTRSWRVRGACHECWRQCSPRVGPTVCGVQEALRVVTFAAGFRCGPVSDVEGSRASGDGAPPSVGATWSARLRPAVSEIRRPKSRIQLLLCSESPLLPSSVVYETWRSSWFHVQRQRGLPVDGAASGFDHSCDRRSLIRSRRADPRPQLGPPRRVPAPGEGAGSLLRPPSGRRSLPVAPVEWRLLDQGPGTGSRST